MGFTYLRKHVNPINRFHPFITTPYPRVNSFSFSCEQELRGKKPLFLAFLALNILSLLLSYKIFLTPTISIICKDQINDHSAQPALFIMGLLFSELWKRSKYIFWCPQHKSLHINQSNVV